MQVDLGALWRIEGARLVAGLTRVVGDVGLAEELAQDALLAALEQWPREGAPQNPAAWLMGVAKHRAIDQLRHRSLAKRRLEERAALPVSLGTEALERAEAAVPDDLLRLIFLACHPVLSRETQVAATLRWVAGLTTPEIARAFLLPEATIAQRIVRGKKTLGEARVPFELPGPRELRPRLEGVLAVVYLVFNEGYAASSGDSWMRPELCSDAVRLARLLTGLLPDEPEVHGLAALLELQSSRLGARLDADGRPVLLLEQDRTRWDRLLIHRGLEALSLVDRLGGSEGPYALQAALAACHARAATAGETDWKRIVGLYDVLQRVAPSPVVALNRAMAVSMAEGPRSALSLVDALTDDPILARSHLLPTLRGDLLARLERWPEARTALERAASMTGNETERRQLIEKAARLPR